LIVCLIACSEGHAVSINDNVPIEDAVAKLEAIAEGLCGTTPLRAKAALALSIALTESGNSTPRTPTSASSTRGTLKVSTTDTIDATSTTSHAQPPSLQAPLARCYNKQCSKTETQGGEFKLCAKCRIARYCSADCQRLAWKDHKAVCGTKTQALAGL